MKNRLERKILGITATVVILSLIGTFTINALTEIESLRRESKEKSRLIGETIERSIRTIMLTGNADIASQWSDDLRSINRLKDLYIVKTNGMLAFRGLDTLAMVNHRLGKELFMRPLLEEVRIMEESDGRLLRVVNNKEGIEYIHKGRQGHAFIQIKPILNGIRCAKCHSDERDVLGVLKITTTMEEVDSGIKRVIITAIAGCLISSLILMAILWMLIRLFVTRPIFRVAWTIKDIIKNEKLDNVVDYRSKDEIGSMVDNFNTMLKRLNGTYATLEERVRERTEQLVRAEKFASIGELATGLVHEMRNPLSGVKLSIQVLEKEIGEPWTADIREVSKEIGRIENLLNELLMFAKPQPPKLFAIDLNEILGRSLSLTRMLAENHKVTIRTGLNPSLSRVMADPDQMQQVFLNIILNAIQAMSNGGSLMVSSKSKDGLVEVSFSDTGPGIPKDYINRIFDPFFTTKGPMGGTGLGLSICNRIIQGHNGRIKVDVSEGKGTTFTVVMNALPEGKQ